MKKIIGIILVSIMILQILSIFILPINAKFIEETNELFWQGNSKIKKEYNENKIQFKEYSHLLTQEEMNQLKKHVGVYDKNKNYNVKYNELGTGLAPPSDEEWNVMVGTVNVVDNNLPNLPLATSIDLSIEPYFPIVRSQGSQGSCAAWAATYYANGYTQAKNNGWNEASIGNNNHLLSPAFTYNKCNHGKDSGSHTWTNGYVMQDVGVCSWSEMPYNSGDDVNWGNENAWRDAPSYRISDIFMIDSYPANYDDSDINIIKNAVESGYPVTFALHASSYNNFGSDDVLGLNAMLTSYNHANTIVGYDDTITDSESGEVGAFKCVNSWGSTWGPASNGYYWMTYNAFKGSQNVYPVCWFGDLYTDSDPKLLGVWELNPQSDRDANIELGIGSYSSPLGTRTPWLDGHSVTMHSYPSFMCLDITEFYNDWISNSNNFYLEFSNSLYNDGTISSFKIEYYDISYITGSPTQISPESGDVPLTTPGYVETQFSQTETNIPPSCTITADPNSGYAPFTATFHISASDFDGTISSWELDIDNDGTPEYFGSDIPTTKQHPYNNAGEYTVELTVWDDKGAIGSDITIVNVYWIPPGPPTNLNVVHSGESSVEDTSDSASINKGTQKNDHTYTHVQDINYHEITEVRVGGSARNPKLGAEVVYTISITGSSIPYTLYIDASREDNEAYDISYQVNGMGYVALGQITTEGYQSWELSSVNMGDTIEVMIKDTIRVSGENQGILKVDHLYIESGGGGGGTEDNKLTWDRSPDDGTGSDDITNYNIYRSDINGESWNYINQVTADNSLSYTYIDAGTGTADPTQWRYVVRAVDAGGLESVNSNSAEEPGAVNNPPASSFTFSVTELIVDFTDTSNDFDGTIINWDWDFGDTYESTLQNPSHTYSADGTYTVSLTVTDDDGETDTILQSVTVISGSTDNDMWVYDISWRIKNAGRNVFLYHTITVISNDGPVSTATVSSTLDGPDGSTWYYSGLTDSNGQVEFSLKVSSSGSYTALVTGIIHASYTYNSGLDVVNPSTKIV